MKENKCLIIKILVVLLAFISTAMIYAGLTLYNAKANTEQIFGFDKGAWIKVVDEKHLNNGGDTNAIRFKFEMNKQFVEENRIESLRVFATIPKIETGENIVLLNKSFNNVYDLVADGNYIHYFDFANIPSNYYAQQISIEVSAICEGGEIESVQQTRSIEYVAATAITTSTNNEYNYLYKYLGGSKTFSNKEQNEFASNVLAEIYLEGYDGAQLKSVFVNSISVDKSVLTVAEKTNTVIIDTSKLSLGENSIMALTVNGDIICIENFIVTKPAVDVTLNELNLFKDEQTTITLDEGLVIKDLLIDNAENANLIADNNLITINNIDTFTCGQHIITVTLQNQSNKIVIPIHIFDDKFIIKDSTTFIRWLKAVRAADTWDSTSETAKKYIYAELENNIDLSSVDLSSEYNSTSCTSGVLDGKGFTIANLFLSSDTSLFYRIYNFTMRNVGFINAKFSTYFLYSDAGGHSKSQLINCYFDVIHSSGIYAPFNYGSVLDLVENVIIKTNISYNNPNTCVFKSSNPRSVKNTFVIGDNTKNNVVIPVVSDSSIVTNCGSYFNFNDFKTAGLDLTSFDDCWDFEGDGCVWGTAQK